MLDDVDDVDDLAATAQEIRDCMTLGLTLEEARAHVLAAAARREAREAQPTKPARRPIDTNLADLVVASDAEWHQFLITQVGAVARDFPNFDTEQQRIIRDAACWDIAQRARQDW